eukprot:jgi/Mesvir1/10662/Mv13751-RA.1
MARAVPAICGNSRVRIGAVPQFPRNFVAANRCTEGAMFSRRLLSGRMLPNNFCLPAKANQCKGPAYCASQHRQPRPSFRVVGAGIMLPSNSSFTSRKATKTSAVAPVASGDYTSAEIAAEFEQRVADAADVLVVDATYLACRSALANKQRRLTADSSEAADILPGFQGWLKGLLTLSRPSRAFAVFDNRAGATGSVRRQITQGTYKARREVRQDRQDGRAGSSRVGKQEPGAQDSRSLGVSSPRSKNSLEEAAVALGMESIKAAEGWEADDVIASLVTALRSHAGLPANPAPADASAPVSPSPPPSEPTGVHPRPLRILIASGDGDMMQLLRDGPDACVSWLQLLPRPTSQHPSGMVLWTVAEFERENGFPPACYADYLALAGKQGDGVGGVAGVGKKGAQKLISRYGSLESVLEAVGRQELAGWKTSIRDAFDAAGIATARRNLSITRLCDDPQLLPRELSLHVARKLPAVVTAGGRQSPDASRSPNHGSNSAASNAPPNGSEPQDQGQGTRRAVFGKAVRTSRLQVDVSSVLASIGAAHECEHVTDEGFSVDIALVERRIAIEVNGPSHYVVATGRGGSEREDEEGVAADISPLLVPSVQGMNGGPLAASRGEKVQGDLATIQLGESQKTPGSLLLGEEKDKFVQEGAVVDPRTLRLNGPSRNKYHRMRRAGWTVIVVPYFEWDQLSGAEAKAEYMRGKLIDALQASVR